MAAAASPKANADLLRHPLPACLSAACVSAGVLRSPVATVMKCFGLPRWSLLSLRSVCAQITPVSAAHIPMHYLLVYRQSFCKYSLIHPHSASSFFLHPSFCLELFPLLVVLSLLLSVPLTTLCLPWFFTAPHKGIFPSSRCFCPPPQSRVQGCRPLPAGCTVLPPGHCDGERDL